MEFEQIVKKISQNIVTSKEILQWRGEQQSNVFHVLATSKKAHDSTYNNTQDNNTYNTHTNTDSADNIDNTQLFKKASKLLNRQQLSSHLQQQNLLGDTPAHLAAWSCDLATLKDIVKVSGHLDFIDASGRNVAMISIRNKDKDIIEYCLEHTKNINQQDKHLQTLLHYAQYFSDKSIYEKIIGLGCSSEIANKFNQKPNSPQLQEEESIEDFVAAHKKKAL